MMNRREALRSAVAAGIGAAGAGKISLAAMASEIVTLPFANGERPLVAYPGKRPLIRLTTRPPQLETPFSVFNDGIITPNDAFFVRYHLAGIPLKIDPDAFRVTIQGKVETPLSLSVAELKAGSSRSRSPQSTNAPATAAVFSSPASPAVRSPTARWATRDGRACRSRRS
jgi:sulfite dehydrogenase (cytochrome) subunit A